MAKVLLNALASTAGGGKTYLRNVLPRLSRIDGENSYLALTPEGRDYSQFADDRVTIETIRTGGGLVGRLFWEQTGLRRYIKRRKIDVLVSLGNFALFASPAPQLLFSRNDLYFSKEFENDLRRRGLYSTLIAHRMKSALARRSIKEADVNIAPTTAFADRIRAFDELSVVDFEVLHFGFDPNGFTSNDDPLPAGQVDLLRLSEGCHRLLYVSHYNYFRNFETLIRALPIVQEQIKAETGKDVLLVLTTDLRRGAVYGGYDASFAADLIDRLQVRENIAMLGDVPYDRLHHLYKTCDLFVCPSYSESFGHPLVEAMAMGTPVVAANLPVHREVCADAASYFDVFDERELAERCVSVIRDDRLRGSMIERGLERSESFSWDEHVRGLVNLIERVLSN
jgi:glycosyltransferase involved in cell wall biosynthesis